VPLRGNLRAFLSLENGTTKGTQRGSITRVEGRRTVTITEAQLEAETPCSIIFDALPDTLADSLLRTLLRERSAWPQNEWWVFEEKRLLKRRTATYDFHDEKEGRSETYKAMKHFVPPSQLRLAHEHIRRAVHEGVRTLESGKDNDMHAGSGRQLPFAIHPLPSHALERLLRWGPTYALGQSCVPSFLPSFVHVFLPSSLPLFPCSFIPSFVPFFFVWHLSFLPSFFS
jgi:hypothetical protein